jgi:hypothetical protein
MLDPKTILDRHSLIVESVLQETPFGTTYLVINQDNNKFVLKIYLDKSKTRGSVVERKFLALANDREFRHLLIPRLIAHDQNYMLMEFIDREYWTRDTILERAWSKSDVRLWVSGLLEFQTIELPANWFSLRRRIYGRFYPIIRAFSALKYGRRVLRMSDVAKIAWLCVRYLAGMHDFRRALTHYDLQTYNYSLTTDRKMASMLDFEIAYYTGDPLFDLLYYNSIPVQKLEEWTYQGDLLRNYIEITGASPEKLENRVRLILLVCNLLGCSRLRDDPAKKKVFEENIGNILHNNWFGAWLGSVFRNSMSELRSETGES